jgi:hypothetical protein
MSTSVAMLRSQSQSNRAPAFQDLSLFNAMADLRGLGWSSVAGLLEYEPTPIAEELVGMVIEDPCGLLTTLTHDQTVRHRVPEQKRSNVTFDVFVKEIFEPYLLKEVGKRFQEAQGQLENFVEEKQLMFQEEMVKSATSWMREQQKAFRRQAMSVDMLRGRVAALERARQEDYDIDLQNDVVMRAAPPLPLVNQPPVHFAAQLATYTVNPEYEAYLTELAAQNMRQQVQLDQQQLLFQEQQRQLALTVSRPSPLETAFAEALHSRRNSPAAVSGLGKAKERRKVSKERRTGAGSGRTSPQPATPTANPLVAALPVVEPRTPVIVVEEERPYAVAGSTPLPATPHNPTAFAPPSVPAAPAKPSGNAGWSGFPGPAAQSATAYCSAGCRIEGDGSDLTWTHRFPCLRSEGERIERPPTPPVQSSHASKLKKIRCSYCDAKTHTSLDECWDFNKTFPPRTAANQPPSSPGNSGPRSDRMDRDDDEGSRFSGYDRPEPTQGRDTEGVGNGGGGIPPTGGNVAGGADPGDSDPSSDSDNSDSRPFDPRKILGRRRETWDEARKAKYDKRLKKLLKLRKGSRKEKKSSQKAKKPERLGVDPFEGDPKDTQRFIQDVEIKLNYFRDSLEDDMDKISLVIPLLRSAAKKWYHSIHVYINEDAAIRDKRPFNPKNELRTWEGFRKRLVASFGGHSDRDRALREWNGLVMQPGKVDQFIDELVRLANELNYSGDYVKDKARVGMTANLRNAWAMKTPLPDDYVQYLDLLRSTGHHLEDVSSFNHIVVQRKDTSHRERGEERSAAKKQRKEKKTVGPRGPRPVNQAPRSFRPQESEHAKAHKDIAQTLIDRRKRLNQCSRCGDPGHFWRKCTATNPVVASAHRGKKRTAQEAGHREIPTNPKMRRIEAPPPAVKRIDAEVRGSAPPILEVDTDTSD